MNSKKALIAGATGLTGKVLLNLLFSTDVYDSVTILTRKPLQLKNEKIKEVIVDFDNLAAYKDFIVADDVFCCLGTTIKKAKTQEAFKKVDLQYPLEIARIAKENGAMKFIVISSMGANSKSSIFYSKVKGIMEESIQKVGFSALHILRPSMLLGDREEFRAGERLGILFFKLHSWLFIGSLKKYKAIHVNTVAKGMFNAAQTDKLGIFVYRSDKIDSI